MPNKSVYTIDKSVIIDFFNKLQTRERKVGKDKKVIGVENSTIWTYRNKLKSFFNWLESEGHIKDNPFKRIPAPKIVDKGGKFLTQSKIDQIMGAIDYKIKWKNNFIRKRNKALMATAFLAGLRRGELLGMRTDNINFRDGYLTVIGTDSKSKKTRTNTLNPVLSNILLDYIEERDKRKSNSPYLFLSESRDDKFTEHGLKHLMEKINECLDFRFHIHQLRHTLAATLCKNGTDVFTIKQILGHRDIRMTVEYLKGIPTENLRSYMDSVTLSNVIS